MDDDLQHPQKKSKLINKIHRFSVVYGRYDPKNLILRILQDISTLIHKFWILIIPFFFHPLVFMIKELQK